MVLLRIVCVGLAIFSGALIYLSLSPKHRAIVLSRLSRDREYTFPQGQESFGPSDQKVDAAKAASQNSDGYASAFPPSRRHVLPTIASTLPLEQGQALGERDVDSKTFQDSLMGWEEDYRTCDESKFVASGFRVREVKAMGTFPDYSALSGVPHPEPYHGFDISRALPRPYRPFRWPYYQTMSLSKLEPDWWIELENTYAEKIAFRKSLYQQHKGSVLAWLPGSELACKELMEMVLQFMEIRYPMYFTIRNEDGKTILENKILGTQNDVYEKHPLLVLLDHVPEDFGIMLRHPETGIYHLRAGMICSALGWNLGVKLGMPLHQIHEPIPDYKEKMQFSMDRFFAKMPTDKPIQRGSWGLEIDTPLYMPPGDPHESYRSHQLPDLSISRCHLRVDWQTLRRLPLSSAVVFNFKGLFTPVTEFRDEPYIPGLLVKILGEGKRNIMEYKNTWHTEHVVVPVLREWEREQVEKGLVAEGWEARTLDEAPWFPGWQRKWRGQQGF